MNVSKVRGLIAEQYGTANEMAQRMGWKPDKLRRILREERKTTTDDVLDMAVALKLMDSPQEIVSIFIA